MDDMPATENVVYSVAGVYFSYHATPGTADCPWVLEDITFEVHRETIVGVIGPNGSGKTSLLKLLGKVLSPQRGEISLFGEPLARMSQGGVARTVAYVPQDSMQVFPFTIEETVLMGRFPHRVGGRFGIGFGWETAKDLRLAEEAMVTMDVGHLRGRLINEVSGGERQRALIARALAQEPRVLLLDEPTAFLDLNHQLDICNILSRLKNQHGLSVILVSHDLNLASQYCDRLVLLQEGRLFRMGTPHDVIRPDVLESVYRCKVLVDRHPETAQPRVTLPGPAKGG